MVDFANAVFLNDDKLFNAIKGDTEEAVFEYRMTMPFKIDKGYHDEEDYKKDDDDVVVYGPVYVGDEEMLDRHKEMVEPKAILESWKSYMKNPVILYNHRKDYGVIGVMEEVKMGHYEDDERKINTVMGRARIDGGEKDIVRKIKKGMLRAFSIGFIAKAAVKECPNDKEDESCYVRFTNIEWIETSVVDIPASPNAIFNVEKSLVSYSGDKAEIRNDVYTTPAEARDRAEELGCSGIHVHRENGESVYMPCASHDAYMEATGEEVSGYKPDDEKSSCSCEGHSKENEKSITNIEQTEDTYIVEFTKDEPMPTPNQEIDELRQEISRLKELLEGVMTTDSVNTHIGKESAMSEEQNSDEIVEEVEIKSEDIDVPTEEPMTVKTEDVEEEEEVVEEEVVEEATEEEATEEEATEEVEEEVEEEATEEVVEEEATEEEVVEEGEEKTLDSEDAVLEEVVKSVLSMEATLKNLTDKLDETESLKSLIAEKDSLIASLTEEKEVAEQEAVIEAEVGKRLAEKMAELGINTTAPAAERKSLSADITPPETKTGTTKFDPMPEVSKGMAGLGSWLSDRIESRGL